MSEERFLSIFEDLKNGELKDSTTAVDLLHAVKLFAGKKEYNEYFIKQWDLLESHCCKSFYIEDYFTLKFLKEIPELKEKVDDKLKNVVYCTMGSKTLMFLNRVYQKIKKDELEIENIFSFIIEELKKEDNKRSSVKLFDLCIFYGFRERLYESHPILATMIMAYSVFKKDAIGSEMFAGSTILGCLLKDHNENIVKPYVEKLLNGLEINFMNMPMIGGGGSSLVYKINDKVLKLGETRNSRRIFVNHRILQSLTRDLLTKNDEDLMWVEIMNYALVGDVTEAERDELRLDMMRQGIIWDDDKLENCGVLQDWDTNDLYYNGEKPKMLASVIDNPVDREEFMKRSRRVVVIDADNMRPNYAKLGR